VHALVLSDNDLRADTDATIQIDHIIVDQPEAAGRDRLAYRLRRVGAIDTIDGIAEIHCPRAERIAGGRRP
jgi:hypothetical protein